MLNTLNARPEKGCAFFIQQNAVKKLSDSYQELATALKGIISDKAHAVLQQVHRSIAEKPELFFAVVLLYDRMGSYIEADDCDALERLLVDVQPCFKQKNTPDSYVFTFFDNKIPAPLISSAQDYLVSELEVKASVVSTSPEKLRRMKENVAVAQKIIQAVSGAFYDEYHTLVNGILVVESDRFIAGSSFPLLSLITLADRHDIDMTVDYLVHETAHQYLYYLTLEDELCSGDGLHTSPLRQDPRPIEGIYHAVFVLARLVCFFKMAQASSNSLVKTHLSDEFLTRQIQNYTDRFYDGLKVVDTHATMTDLGRHLINSAKQLVESCT